MEEIERSKSLDITQFVNKRQMSGLEFAEAISEEEPDKASGSGTDSDSDSKGTVSDGEEKSDEESASAGTDSEERESKAKIEKLNKGEKTNIAGMQEQINKEQIGTLSLEKDDTGVIKPVNELVDENMKKLLQACMKLKRPTLADLEGKYIDLGPRESQKLLILDMDETLIHA